MSALTEDELDLLRWLGESEFSQYGECDGEALDRLVALGLAQVHEPGAHQDSFIAKGGGEMYRAVSLTKAGHAALKERT